MKGVGFLGDSSLRKTYSASWSFLVSEAPSIIPKKVHMFKYTLIEKEIATEVGH
jgi:hypothetical protein